MKKRKIFIGLIVALFFLFPINIFALSSDYKDQISDITGAKVEDGKINFYLFRGQGCPHCAEEEKWIESIKEKYKDKVNFYDYEVWYNQYNSEMLKEVGKKLDLDIKGVPFTVIGDKYFSGFSETIQYSMEDTLDEYLGEEYKPRQVKIPFLGKINMKNSSIGLIAVILGFIDGFNPCAMWILLFLINMFIGMKNKKKAWILGFTFLLVSAFIYFLSMIGINFIVGVATIKYLKIALAIFILVMGIIGFRKYLTIRKEEAGCTIVDDKKRKNLVKKVKKIMNSKSFIISLIGVSTLAISVNLIELACSLGFPMIFTEMLTINEVGTVGRIIYLLIYVLFYMIDDLFVFTVSMATLEATGITNKYNKLCTLVSSIIMILMGLLLIFKPEWLMLNF